jgi:hypothetical protein
MQISGEQYQRLVKQARAISEMAESQFCREAAAGAGEQQLVKLLLDLATQRGNTPRSLAEVSDEALVSGLTSGLKNR